MAKSLNRVQLIGRLGGDPELKVTSAGIQVATFSLATNRQWTAKDGNAQEETDWHNIVAWERLAQICHDHLSKGRLVYIEGRIRTRTYESNGQKQYRTEIVASDMLMLDSAGGAETQRDEPGRQERTGSAPRPKPTDVTATASRARRPAVDEPLEDAEDMPF